MMTTAHLEALVLQQGQAISDIVGALAATAETLRLTVDAACQTHQTLAEAVKHVMERVELIEQRVGYSPKEE